ncbi:MAG: flagellar basal body rod protein FlgC [Planctomycetota bacterium]
MDLDRAFSTFQISASGLSAERLRMRTIAQNIANANTSARPGETPYRKRELVFQAVLDDAMSPDGLGGVRVTDVVENTAPGRVQYLPGHPHADEQGFVRFSNVNAVTEMVDMIAASRAYESDLALLTTFKEMMQETLRLGR